MVVACLASVNALIRQTVDTFPFRQHQVTNKRAEELLSGWVQDVEIIRIDLAEDASSFVFETLREDEAVEA